MKTAQRTIKSPEEVERYMKKDTALETIYSEVKFKFEDTLKERESWDFKSATLLGFAGVITSICLALLFSVIGELRNEPSFRIFEIFFRISIISIFLSGLCSLVNIYPRKYKVGPEVDKIYEDISKDKEEVLEYLLKTYKSNFDCNRKKNDDKVKLFKWSFCLIATGIIFLYVSLIIVVMML